jgi:hypothetical protein
MGISRTGLGSQWFSRLRMRQAAGLLLLAAALPGCPAGSGGGGGGGTLSGFVPTGLPGTWSGGSVVPASYDAPYGVLTGNSVATFRGTLPLVTAKRFYIGVTATESIGGQTFQKVTGGWDITGPQQLATAGDKSISVTLARPTPTVVQIAAVQHPGFASATFDPPLTFDMGKPVGEKVTYTGSGTFQMKPEDPVGTGTGKLDLTVVETNATVQTDSGVIAGTTHLAGTLAVSGEGVPDIVRDLPFSGDLWVHPDLGVVKAVVPDLGIGVGWEGLRDCTKASVGDIATCRGTSVLDTNVPTFRLSTKDRSGVADADKMQHAKLLVEIRYANEADATTLTDKPVLNLDIGNSYGSYGGGFVSSPISYFHPEENGKGYKYWNAYIDQADKYQPGPNGIEYYINVERQSNTPPVRVTARLLYHLAP